MNPSSSLTLLHDSPRHTKMRAYLTAYATGSACAIVLLGASLIAGIATKARPELLWTLVAAKLFCLYRLERVVAALATQGVEEEAAYNSRATMPASGYGSKAWAVAIDPNAEPHLYPQTQRAGVQTNDSSA